ncbi:MAG: sulfurtransferase [Bifidobacteriaceae bacterium]|jgi:thiosulfate/3-mercaptopyruvate sulfurtransferase|nr:sulfurtransferase [Bifidobacteriaceae bacterium]
MIPTDSPLVTVADLRGLAQLGGPGPESLRVRLLDVRWQLGRDDGFKIYRDGHIPGAVFVNLDHELAGPPSPAEGRHPIPSLDTLRTAAQRWGLQPGQPVVAYDGDGNYAAARLWWLLRDAGFTDVHLLDGALPAWVAAGYPLQRGAVDVPPGTAQLGPWGHMPRLTIDQAATFAVDGGLLLDARAPERFRGEVEPVDPKAGHIPGAISAPTGENLTSDGHFLEPAQLAARFRALGVTEDRPVGSYCGSGVTAAHQVFALELAGFKAALYPGSWSQWSNTDRPVATT